MLKLTEQSCTVKTRFEPTVYMCVCVHGPYVVVVARVLLIRKIVSNSVRPAAVSLHYANVTPLNRTFTKHFFRKKKNAADDSPNFGQRVLVSNDVTKLDSFRSFQTTSAAQTTSTTGKRSHGGVYYYYGVAYYFRCSFLRETPKKKNILPK